MLPTNQRRGSNMDIGLKVTGVIPEGQQARLERDLECVVLNNLKLTDHAKVECFIEKSGSVKIVLLIAQAAVILFKHHFFYGYLKDMGWNNFLELRDV